MRLGPFSMVPVSPHKEWPGSGEEVPGRGVCESLQKLGALSCDSSPLLEQQATQATRKDLGALAQCLPENGDRSTWVQITWDM